MQTTIDLAKNILPEKSDLDLQCLFAVLLQQPNFIGKYPTLEVMFPQPEAQEVKAEQLKPDSTVRAIFAKSKEEGLISGELVFEHALFHDNLSRDLNPTQRISLQSIRARFQLEQYKRSSKRARFVKNVSRFGSFLTDEGLQEKDLCGREELLPQIARALMKMRTNDAMLVGPSGVGKTAIIQEFARRVHVGHETIPISLHGAEVFQISPENLTVGAVSRPQFMSRIETLNEHLQTHPKIILVINPMDALVSKDSRRPDAVMLEELIRQLIQTNIPILATMSPGSHLLLDSKPEWENIFEVFRIPEPPTDRLIGVLNAQVPNFKRHYVGIDFQESGLEAVIEYAKRTYPTQCEPRRSVQFLDELCVRAQTGQPMITELSRQTVEQILSEPLHANSARINVNTDELYEALTDRIVGQDAIMKQVSGTITTRMSKWASNERPRGVFLFGGPTGVGKTETAVQLAQILSGSASNLIRVDCNTLQPTGHQKTSVIWTLLGVPPGYMGHGEGGLLSKVREKPNAIILFDEFEKADAAVGKLLLQILDTGLQQDNMGTMLDFRQAFIIFTSNLGCDYQEAPPQLGFGSSSGPAKKVPTVDESKLRSELRMMGYGPEFLARIHKIFLFSALGEENIAVVITKLVESLQPFIQDQGYTLIPSASFAADVAKKYEPRDGVRGIINKVRAEFTRSISENERKGNLQGIQTICLNYDGDAEENSFKRDDDALHLYISLNG
jgi:ATP-dependent Clp protease ATP-binding subunit ClpA